MDALSRLEAETVTILREVYRASTKPCMLWSIGKDSTALLWMARKAFFGHVPFPMVLLETHMELPEVYAFRDEIIARWQVDYFAQICPSESAVDQTLPPAARAAARKTEGLRTMLREQKFDAVIV
ncbi:MAG TPA: phosphoadenosine phosphosulfate reductase family protein, partial [Candidatus Lustribacter sp.]